ncbi:MAG: TOBE domain-containing protein [Acidobacteria bacterium]|nr:TOBE domain-containing protein [Acidobacteriota bacterium]
MTNRFRAVVEACSPRESLAWLRIGRGRVAARLWPGIRKGMKVRVRIEPGEILLFEGHPGRTSARNVLPGHVRSIRHAPEGAFVTLDAGFPLTALVTRRAVAELGLRRGSPVFAVFKVMAVSPEHPVRARARLCLVGVRGTIGPDRIDFLRAIRRTGSLSAAAREFRVHYRTAWMWVQGINRAWGKPLVARIRGGRGGGGASLTPEAEAVLASAEPPQR